MPSNLWHFSEMPFSSKWKNSVSTDVARSTEDIFLNEKQCGIVWRGWYIHPENGVMEKTRLSDKHLKGSGRKQEWGVGGYLPFEGVRSTQVRYMARKKASSLTFLCVRLFPFEPCVIAFPIKK